MMPTTEETLKPEIKTLESADNYGKFVLEPLERGFGVSVGNPLRRVLLNSIPGSAVTWVKIEGVLHEYQSLPHMKEEAMEFLLNVKGIRIRSLTGRPGKMRLEVQGEGRVVAGDIAASSGFEVVNPELHLATLDAPGARLSVEFNVEQGKGYQPAMMMDGLPVGVLPVDAIFSPVTKVNYGVERMRVGQATDFERLVFEVWTDGAMTPLDAVRKAAEVLVNHFFLYASLGKAPEMVRERTSSHAIPADVYQTPIERLELSPRTLNCLRRARITRVGQVLEMSKDELLKIRNFGAKSLDQLYGRLRDHGFMAADAGEDGTGASENGTTPDSDDEDEGA